MSQIIYVKGNILNKSKNFKYKGGDGCLFSIPEGATTIEPTTELDGTPTLIFDDNTPLSIFNTYHATGAFSAISETSYFYNIEVNEIYNNYIEVSRKFERMLKSLPNADVEEKDSLYKYLMVSVISIFESFFRDIIVSRVASDEESFNIFYSKYFEDLSDKRKESLERMSRGKLERHIITYLYNESFSNAQKINTYFKIAYGNNDSVCTGTNIGKYIKMRHNIAHNNAKQENGEYNVFTYKEVCNAIRESNKVVEKMMSHISNH